jgi:translocator protein
MAQAIRLPKLIALILGCEAAGIAGTVFTRDALVTWYPGLNRPSYNPPNWIFGPVWTLLYGLMGTALYLVSESQADDQRTKRLAKIFFGLQLALNVLWTVIFFGRRSPLYALVEIALLWAAIVVTIVTFWRLSRPAALLLVPYLCWTSFAALLTYKIWELNS